MWRVPKARAEATQSTKPCQGALNKQSVHIQQVTANTTSMGMGCLDTPWQWLQYRPLTKSRNTIGNHISGVLCTKTYVTLTHTYVGLWTFTFLVSYWKTGMRENMYFATFFYMAHKFKWYLRRNKTQHRETKGTGKFRYSCCKGNGSECLTVFICCSPNSFQGVFDQTKLQEKIQCRKNSTEVTVAQYGTIEQIWCIGPWYC